MQYDTYNFRKIGESLFGMSWQASLATAIGVNERTMRRWASGENPTPQGVWAEMANLCSERGAMLLLMAYHNNLQQIELNNLSLRQLQDGGHTGSNNVDTTEETKARLIKANKDLERASTMLKAAILPLSGQA